MAIFREEAKMASRTADTAGLWINNGRALRVSEAGVSLDKGGEECGWVEQVVGGGDKLQNQEQEAAGALEFIADTAT